ncbi:DsbA family oxidoreductase [Psychrobacillus sp.]|uniref:DsbA family oxidoreductase n=1 Tax=Psychrobacillus sp. TaxID=1871623 RepID=UPI0028BF312E|nr:DsbA family oxidoreductase [Psychrobacillus sp.]
MKIELFSDFTCPFCYIGKRQLEQAISEAGYEGKVEIEYKAYQIAPHTPFENAPSFLDGLAAKYEMSLEEVKQTTEGISARAKEVGLEYDFDRMKTANTEKAHRLAKWAKQFQQDQVFTELLMKSYFTEGADLIDEAFLLSTIAELELDVEEAKEVLHSTKFMEEIEKDSYDAQQIGVESVPFFVFENKYGIVGAEPSEVFVKTLHQAAEIAGIRPSLSMVGDGANSCADGQCNI